MRVGLFVTCPIDLMRPEVGLSVLELLGKVGYDMVVPPTQICCGQPTYNSGDCPLARDLAEKAFKELEQLDHAVILSDPCDDMIREGYTDLFRDDPEFADRYKCLVPRVYGLTDFLVNMTRIEALDSEFHGHVAYHDSCFGLRELGVKAQPRELLRKLPGMQLIEVPTCEACYGLGGTLSIKYSDISTAIVGEKCANIKANGADAVTFDDVSYMLNIEGRLRRTDDTHTRVLHVMQVLAGGV